jgi:di/tricarboxylate transporter
MTLEAWLVIAVVLGCLGGLLFTRTAPELILFGGVALLLVAGVITPTEALSGFANEGLITVALLYVVVAGVRETGGIDFLVNHVLGRPRHLRGALARLLLPVTAMSAFINNTPAVAMFLPAVLTWSRRLQISPSKLLIPLSYGAIVGGTITLIGTSTNLVVNGLLLSRGEPGFSLFEIAWVGLPTAVVGVLYMMFCAPRWLPERLPASVMFENPKEYTVEMMVEAGSPLAGKTVEQAGLRHLHGLYLVEIERENEVLAAVGPYERLQAGDRLVFAGVVDAVVELQRFKGLTPCADHIFSLEDREHRERVLVEAVVSPRCALIGKTIREGRFRMTYGGSVIAVTRDGNRIAGKIGDIVLQPGDTLLLDVRPPFLERHRNSSDFLLISPVSDYIPVRHERAWVAWCILAGVVLTAASGLLSMLEAAMLGAALMLLSGSCSVGSARRSIDAPVLLAIAAAFGLGKALEVSGAAARVAEYFLQLADGHPWIVLACVYLITSVLTEVITNNSVAVLMFPIVMALAEQLGVSHLPFMIALMMAASASFATPIGYQTNLMVYGPGGYRFADFLKFGIPMNVLVAVVAVLIIPWVWPFGG